MSRLRGGALALCALALGWAAPAGAQSLAERIADAPADQAVRFSYASRPGVCGTGENVMVRSADGDTSVIRGNGRRRGWEALCEEGPVHVQLEREGRSIVDVEMRVGPRPSFPAPGGAGIAELGEVGAGEAVEALQGAVTSDLGRRAAGELILASTLADAESWPGLLVLARERSLDDDARSSAVFWLAQAAGERATEGLVSLIGDDSDEMEVRESAVFALSQVGGSGSVDALMTIARTHSEPKLRKSAMFWLGQSDDPRVIEFFERILLGRG